MLPSPLSMHKFALVLACVACRIHGVHALSPTSKLSDVDSRVDHRRAHVTGASNPLRALEMLLFASTSAAAFTPSITSTPSRQAPLKRHSSLSRCSPVMTTATISAFQLLEGQQLTRVSDGEKVDVGKELGGPGLSLCILGTYPADFNMIEYLQHLVPYIPDFKARGVTKFLVTINGSPASAKLIAQLVGLPDEVVLLSDETGSAGRAFGVGRGWLPDVDELTIGGIKLPISPYAKLFGMLLGLGARDTLPSVITGYLGNPWGSNKWIKSALAQGQRAGRWPDTVLDLDDSGAVVGNKFDDLPIVGSWGRRPLELATLRLQTMIGISLARWDDLQPVDDRCLTQLGGMALVWGGRTVYEWRDNGICNVPDFERVLKTLDTEVKSTSTSM